MFNSWEVEVLFPSWWRRRDSEAQGRRREAGSESSMRSLTRFLRQRLKLKVNEAKSAVARVQQRKIGELTRRTRSISLPQMVKELASCLRGIPQFRIRSVQSPIAQGSQPCRIRFAGCDRAQHTSATCAQQITDYAGQFDPTLFEQTFQLALQPHPIPPQLNILCESKCANSVAP